MDNLALVSPVSSVPPEANDAAEFVRALLLSLPRPHFEATHRLIGTLLFSRVDQIVHCLLNRWLWWVSNRILNSLGGTCACKWY
jgi:hypothetical protein